MCIYPVYLKNRKHFVPCRNCLECKMQRAKEWSVRCYFEMQRHSENCFITLTYDDQHNPVQLQKKHLQDFWKRLRKAIEPIKIKYFACGEYGDRSYRPHYHAIIFGYDFPDRMPCGQSRRSKPIYISEMLGKLWTYGIHSIQDATQSAVIYTALYASKHISIQFFL